MGNLHPAISDQRSHLEQEYLKSEGFRQQAYKFHQKSSEQFDLSKRAFQRREHKKAKVFSETGKLYRKLKNEANGKAADAIFNFHNSPEKQTKFAIDLHGLFVSEAIDRLIKRVLDVKRENGRELTIIVGKGINSRDGPKLKPAVDDFARSRKIRYHMNSPNSGCIRFEFEETGLLMRMIYGFARLFRIERKLL